ncbi:MAG TPA: 16S rRNA (guanine(527)-N(7))-methyltransferase RsmG [Dehalococcoidia bacterium]|jgi:16S rRNA (guanine527-N7)-methyltransferase
MTPGFAAAIRGLVPSLSDEAIAKLTAYRDLLAASAREFNLVSASVRGPEAIERRHIGEALAFGALLAERGLLADGARVLDVGSGAGLPGLPLKLAWPALDVTLLEATGKKCRFLDAVASQLGLQGLSVVEGRAEEVAHDPAHRGAYDLVLARAVAPLPVLLEYCLPFVREGGAMAAIKGSGAQRELAASEAALRELAARLEQAAELHAPDTPAQTVFILRKTGPTPERYPRRTGIPTKRPIA